MNWKKLWELRIRSASCILFPCPGWNNFETKTGHMKKQERINRQEEMLSLIEQWQESGKSQQLFCQEHDLTYTTFYYWLRRYRRQLDESSFLPVEISSGSHIEIRYPGGVILQLPAATRLVTLKQLLCLWAVLANVFTQLHFQVLFLQFRYWHA